MTRRVTGKTDVYPAIIEGLGLVDTLKEKLKAETDRANVTVQDLQVRRG